MSLAASVSQNSLMLIPGSHQIESSPSFYQRYVPALCKISPVALLAIGSIALSCSAVYLLPKCAANRTVARLCFQTLGKSMAAGFTLANISTVYEGGNSIMHGFRAREDSLTNQSCFQDCKKTVLKAVHIHLVFGAIATAVGAVAFGGWGALVLCLIRARGVGGS